jgi:hypothetical protein
MRDGGMMSFEIKIRDGSFRISLELNGTKRAGIPADWAAGPDQRTGQRRPENDG